MSLIKIEHLTFSYPDHHQEIFSNASFQIDTEWKLGLIGRNGKGKTTLLDLLRGKYPYSGKIYSQVKFDYFPYDVSDESLLANEVLLNICPDAEEWELIREISLLKVDKKVLYHPFYSLSMGEKTKLLLAALFLNPGHFLLIDEPTNHLDIEGRRLVSSYLQKKSSFILVSHDLKFMDGCIDHVLSLNRSDIQVQTGNLSSFLLNKERRLNFEKTKDSKLKKDIDRLEESYQRNTGWSMRAEQAKYGDGHVDKGYIGHKAAKMMKRAKNIQNRTLKAIEEKKGLLSNQEEIDELKVPCLEFRTDLLATLIDVSPIYDDQPISEKVSFEINQHDRIALIGSNGCGKSSLIKLLLDKDKKHTGKVILSSGLVISYLPQDLSFLKGKLSEYITKNNIDETLFKALLRKMDFEREMFEKDIVSYSMGQKKKVALACSLCQQAHLYIWDEPLNYMDIYSRQQLQETILTSEPTLLFIEHDEDFINNIATKIVHIKRT